MVRFRRLHSDVLHSPHLHSSSLSHGALVHFDRIECMDTGGRGQCGIRGDQRGLGREA